MSYGFEFAPDGRTLIVLFSQSKWEQLLESVMRNLMISFSLRSLMYTVPSSLKLKMALFCNSSVVQPFK